MRGAIDPKRSARLPAGHAEDSEQPDRTLYARVAGRRFLAALMLCGTPALGQVLADSQPVVATDDLAPIVRLLLAAIEAQSDYRATGPLPSIFQMPQYRIEQKVCDAPCNVRAAYLPREGIYLSANLDPERDPLARSALLHELVHYLQQGHAKFEGMDTCERERAKEQEAYAIQNAYLAAIGNRERVVFYDDFDCGSVASAPPR
jgi:hypothetical protein